MSKTLTEPEINTSTYQWCIRAFSFLKGSLGVKINCDAAPANIESGQIFLFNHFARFETVIPQYIIHQATGAYCRCVATSELFESSERFAKFLWGVGAVPNDHPGLLPFLAAEILRGQKVIIFPEGGMIKDRKVVEDDGSLGIFSPTANQSRKHHKGAAALALTLEMFKRRILSVHEAGETARLQRWVNALGLDSAETLLAAAGKPTHLVPGNITFYPVHNDANALAKLMETFGVEISERAREELLIESNIILKDTDMHVRMGDPITPQLTWAFWERWALDRAFKRIRSLDDLFALKDGSDRWLEKLLATAMTRETRRLRDASMADMYALTSVNLSHLASKLILTLIEQAKTDIDIDRFHRLLYLTIKYAQMEETLHLHASVANPEAHENIHCGVCDCPEFEKFLTMAHASGLIEARDGRYHFLAKLTEDHDFHQIRLENMIEVYANEVAPLPAVCRAVTRALKSEADLDEASYAHLLFDDEVRAHDWALQAYSEKRHKDINDQETATEPGTPYLFLPESADGRQDSHSSNRQDNQPGNRMGIVLVHGFLASAAELRDFGEKLAARGYPVLGVRLKGHGTSPWDLRERSWHDWLQSVRRGFEIMSGFTDRVCLVGFSTGGALALRLAAEKPAGLAGVAAVAAPIKFRNKKLIFVPVIHGLNKITQWVSSQEGVMPFRVNDSEHPEINYRHMPIRGLYELRQMVDDLEPRLGDIEHPALILQGDGDQIVDPASAEIIHDNLGSRDKAVHLISSNRHGLLNENIGGTHDRVFEFIAGLEGPANTVRIAS